MVWTRRILAHLHFFLHVTDRMTNELNYTHVIRLSRCGEETEDEIMFR